MRIDLVHAVKAGCCGSGHEEIALRSEGEVIRGHTGFQSREHEDLAVARDLENSAAAVADIEIF